MSMEDHSIRKPGEPQLDEEKARLLASIGEPLSETTLINGHRLEESVAPHKEALEKQFRQIFESNRDVNVELVKELLKFSDNVARFTEDALRGMVKLIEQFQHIKAELAKCDLIPQKSVLNELTLSELVQLVDKSPSNPKATELLCIAMDKVSGKLFGGDAPANTDRFYALDADHKIGIRIRIDYEGIEAESGIVFPEKLTLQDQQFYDAITSAYEAGNSFITDGMIYRILSGSSVGKYSRGNLPRDFTQQLEVSLQKFRGVLSIETKEGRLTTPPEPLLMFTRKEITLLGNQVKAILISRTPLLWRLAWERKEISKVKIEALQIGDYRTKDLRFYLLRRISRIRSGDSARQKSIRLDTVCKEVGATTDKQKKTVREKSELMLKFWKETGLIQDFKAKKIKHSKIVSGWDVEK